VHFSGIWLSPRQNSALPNISLPRAISAANVTADLYEKGASVDHRRVFFLLKLKMSASEDKKSLKFDIFYILLLKNLRKWYIILR
jgi:hypothetical protein